MTGAAIAKSAGRLPGNATWGGAILTSRLIDVDLTGDRRLELRRHGAGWGGAGGEGRRPRSQHLADLWEYEVRLVEGDDELRLCRAQNRADAGRLPNGVARLTPSSMHVLGAFRAVAEYSRN